MGKNNKNENVHVERQDNTQVRHPILQERFQKTSPTRQIQSYIETFGIPQQPQLSQNISSEEKEIAKGRYQEEQAKQRLKEKGQMIRENIGFIPMIGDVTDLGITTLEVASDKEEPSMLGASVIGFLPFGDFIKGSNFFKNLSSKYNSFRNRKLRMTHVTTLDDIQRSLSKGDRSLIVPSWSIYKHNGKNLFMYNKGNQPIVFIGNRNIVNSPNYVQMKGDRGVPMLDNMFDFSEPNSVISTKYVENFGDRIKKNEYPFDDVRKNLNYVNYNEGKYLGELPYTEASYVIGPDIDEFKEIFKDQQYVTYPLDWSKLDKDKLRSNLQELIEQLYKENKNIRLKQGGIIGINNIGI